MYDEVKDIIKSKDSKNVLDLYCGSGTIGIYISDSVDNVVGIEVVESSITDAIKNKEINNVNNIDFILGKVEDKINDIKIDIDTIIVDPPRSGLSDNVIDSINKINPKNIIYISCNPISFADNINKLSNYLIKNINVYDMFPNTYHCESVCILERK